MTAYFTDIVTLTLNIFSLILLALIFHSLQKKSEKVEKMQLKSTRRVSRDIDDEAKAQIAQVMDRVSTKLEGQVKAMIEEFAKESSKVSQQLAAHAGEQQSTIARESQFLVANSLSKVQKELEVYRANQLKKIDEEINSIVFEAAREVLGRAISQSEHEDLVHKALEKAKKDKLFS